MVRTFSGCFSGQSPSKPLEIGDEDLPLGLSVDVGNITIVVRKAIGKLKREKANAEDITTAEMVNVSNESALQTFLGFQIKCGVKKNTQPREGNAL